jgi:hypothetical protein
MAGPPADASVVVRNDAMATAAIERCFMLLVPTPQAERK